MFYLFLVDGFEEIEAVTIIDILRRAKIKVSTVGIGGKMITGSHGITITADISDEPPDLLHSIYSDIEGVILPGGSGTDNLSKSDTVKKALSFCFENNRYIMAICAAPSIPGQLGMLRGVRSTCYPGCESLLIGAVITNSPVATDGKFITSKAPATAIPFALEIVRQIKGDDIAENIRQALQYHATN